MFIYAGPAPPPYRPNQKVEVVGGEPGMLGSFFEAIVVRKVDPTHWEVEYETLLAEDRSGKLREILPVLRIRPRPPRVAYDSYVREDWVDCLTRDGYWSGKVSDVCAFGNIKTFEVEFPLMGNKVKEVYRANRLRPHVDWDGYKFTTQPHFRFMLR